MERDWLETLRDGVVSPEEALASGRQLIASETGRAALEDGGRDWLIAAARGEGVDAKTIRTLEDAFRRFGALAQSLAPATEVDPHVVFALHMEACADIASDLAAFTDSYSADALRAMPHFENCLTLLYHAQDHAMARGELLRELGLKEANGTRVLKALEKVGFVSRQQEGRTKRVQLTSRGRTTICRWISPDRNEAPQGAQVLLLTPVAGMSGAYPARRVGRS